MAKCSHLNFDFTHLTIHKVTVDVKTYCNFTQRTVKLNYLNGVNAGGFVIFGTILPNALHFCVREVRPQGKKFHLV